jgi:hypothetical protein
MLLCGYMSLLCAAVLQHAANEALYRRSPSIKQLLKDPCKSMELEEQVSRQAGRDQTYTSSE